MSSCIEYRLTSSVPYALVEHRSWQALFQYLDPRAVVQSRQSVTLDIKELHAHLQHAADQRFRAAETACSVQTDVWTAKSGQLSFTGGNISWIDQSWELHTDFAFFTPLLKRHSGVNLAEPLASWLRSRALGDKVVSLATDGASNNITMIESLSYSFSSFADRKNHVLCACHSIGRVVFAFMKALGCSIPALRPLGSKTVPMLCVNDKPIETSPPPSPGSPSSIAEEGDLEDDADEEESEEETLHSSCDEEGRVFGPEIDV